MGGERDSIVDLIALEESTGLLPSRKKKEGTPPLTPSIGHLFGTQLEPREPAFRFFEPWGVGVLLWSSHTGLDLKFN